MPHENPQSAHPAGGQAGRTAAPFLPKASAGPTSLPGMAQAGPPAARTGSASPCTQRHGARFAMRFALQTAAWLLPEVGWGLLLWLKRDCLADLPRLFWLLCGAQLSPFILAIPRRRGVVGSRGLHHPQAEVNICFHLKPNKNSHWFGKLER